MVETAPAAAVARPELVGVGIVVVNFGSAALIEENLTANGLARSGVSVHVVDNFRCDADRDEIRSVAARHGWLLLEMDRNLGFGEAVNRGARSAFDAGCDVLFVLNPDATLPADALARLVGHVRANPRHMAAPLTHRPDGRPAFRGAVVDVPAGTTRTVDGSRDDLRHPWLSGAAIAVSRAMWQALGGFAEDYFMYWEDVDLSWRCVEAGGWVTVLPDAVAVHSVGATQGEGLSPLYIYWNCRNRLLFASRHLSRRDQLRWALRTPAYARNVVLRGGRRQLLRSPRPLWAAISGSWAGLVVLATERRREMTTAGASRL